MKRIIPLFLVALAALGVGYGTRVLQPTNQSIAFGPRAKSGAELQEELRASKLRDKQFVSDKFDAPDEFAQYHYDIRTPEGAEGPAYPLGYRTTELQKMQQQMFAARGQAVQTVNAVWTERGPNNVAGRARGLVVDPDDETNQTWYVGSVGGGVWKTTDKGQNWEILTPDLPNLATTMIEMAPSNHDVLYVGTGEGYFNGDAIRGDGIFKSTDRGETWTQLASTASNTNFSYVNRMTINPDDENTVVVATNSGVYRTTDGGDSWTTVLEPGGRSQDLDADPNNWNRQYLSVNGTGIYRSEDGGLTWELKSAGLSVTDGTGRRFETAISPVNTDHIFVSLEVGNANDRVFFTTDGAETWSEFGAIDGTSYEYLGGQGWYDNTIVAHPYDENKAMLAGVEIFEVDITQTSPTPVGKVLGATSSADFMSYINFGGQFLGGGMEITSFEDGIDLTEDDFVSVEIRFGTGLSQKAHRFTVPENGGANGDGGAGVPATDYTYQDYVEVPFEVWDIDNNIQLNVSFRDQENDGTWDLEGADPNDGSRGREYIFVNATPYNADAPDENITSQSRGHFYKQLFFVWGRLASGSTWNPEDVPEATISMEYGNFILVEGDVAVISDPYGRYNGNNSRVHPDHHNLYVVPTDAATESFWLINLNDGGGSLSEDNGEVVTQWGTTMHTSQFYGADKAPGEDRYIGGLQDNGTWSSPSGVTATSSTNYNFNIGGDGFEVAWHFSDDKLAIGGSQYNGLARTTDGGATWVNASVGMEDRGSGRAPFITRIGNGKSNPDYLFVVGPSGVWRSKDFGGQWELINMGDAWNGGGRVQVAVSPANPAIVWAGTGMTESVTPYVSTDFGSTFNGTGVSEDISGGFSGIDGHTTEDSTAFVLYSFFGGPHVLRTQDLGQTWEDLSQVDSETGESANGFPNVATYCAITMPHMPEVIWVGTEIGIVESSDNGASWHLLDSEFPNVAVWDMKVADGQIVVATHGRGIWTATIDDLPEIGVIPVVNSGSLTPSGDLALLVDLRSSYDSSYVFVDDQLAYTLGTTSKGEGVIKGSYTGPEGLVNIVLVGYLNGKAYPSFPREAQLLALEPLTQYVTTFNENTGEDFYGDGFSVTTASGFIPDDYAIHSEHPYQVNTDYSYQLLYPIIVADENALMAYEDVAIIEKGDSLAEFGDRNFFDYVIVEATNDGGVNWQPLLDGYDANFKTSWSNTIDDGRNGNANQFEEHIIDLHDVFDAGDTILIRFRLFSDPGVAAWGWVIDELRIQDPQLIEEVTGLAPTLDLSLALYPNPVAEELSISYNMKDVSDVSILITDLSGKAVSEIPLGNVVGKRTEQVDVRGLPPGRYFVTVNSSYGRQSKSLIIR